jgi:uncharacterized protein
MYIGEFCLHLRCGVLKGALMEIKIQKLTDTELKTKGIFSWPIWEKEISRFDWYYDQTEECLLLAGQVVVETKDGKKVEFGRGDFVTFPKGLACSWDIKSPVRKHYNFK